MKRILSSVAVFFGTLVLSSALVGPASAGGLYIQEWGTPSQGAANAGAQAAGEAAATAFHNPAAMTRLDDHAFVGGAGLLIADIKFDQSNSTPVAGGNGGQQGGPGPVLSAHYVHRLYDRDDATWLDRFRLGLSVVSLSGAVLDPKNQWAGRYEVQELSLLTISALPSFGIRLHETFSVGVGAVLTYGRLDYKLAFANPINPNGPEGRAKFDWIDDFDAAPTVSALWEPLETTRMGVFWQDEIKLNLDGDVNIDPANLSLDTKVKIPFAQLVHTSILHEFSDAFWVAASFRWEDWSTFGNQLVNIQGVTGNIPRNWRDTWGGGMGFRYAFDETWAMLAGFGYDSSPVKAKNRTADMPVDRQWRLATSLQMTQEKRTYGVNFSYANLGKSKIRSSNLRGSYDNNQLFSLTFYVSLGSLPWGMDPGGA
jgi:long-chain fatty acid transport protein